MRVTTAMSFFCIFAVCCFAGVAPAQETPVQQPVTHAADGGADEVLESIEIPSIAHAPFYATLDTEWERPLAGGGSYTIENERHIARDSAGRVYEERWYLVPKNGKIPTKMDRMQVFDSVTHQAYLCSVDTKMCYLRSYYAPVNVEFSAPTNAKGVLPGGWGFVTHEDLGKQTVAGIETRGVRETDTINPWMVGNDRPMSIVREYWHSAALNMNLLSTLTDPRIGTQRFTITEISTSEPDPKLFLPPAEYRVVDQRSYAPPAQ
jgi:hypothetical protein